LENHDLYTQFGIPKPPAFSTTLEVYVCEQNNELRLIIAHHLEKLGFRSVRTARDGRVALKELKLKPAHIVLVGDETPTITGLDMTKEFREQPSLSRGALVLITKPVGKNEVMLALETGVDDLLLRPIAAADIMPRMRSAYGTFTNPKNPERVYEYAKAKLRAGDLEGAKVVYEALSLATEKAARPFIGLARVAQAQKNLPEALRFASEGVARNENYVHAFALRAEILLAMGDVPGATKDFETAVGLSPLNVIRYEGCCDILVSVQKFEECIEILEKGIKAGLRHPYIIERLGFCHFQKKEFSAALKHLKEAVRMDPQNITYLNSLAICLRDSKEYDEAISIYNKILKMEPEAYQILFNKSLVFYYKGDQAETKRLLHKVLKIRPDFQKARDKLVELGEHPDELSKSADVPPTKASA
jgi:tetratricopeptide (TPR) repeat protein